MQEKYLDEMLLSAAKSFETQSERCCQLETSCLKKRLFNVVVILTSGSSQLRGKNWSYLHNYNPDTRKWDLIWTRVINSKVVNKIRIMDYGSLHGCYQGGFSWLHVNYTLQCIVYLEWKAFLSDIMCVWFTFSGFTAWTLKTQNVYEIAERFSSLNVYGYLWNVRRIDFLAFLFVQLFATSYLCQLLGNHASGMGTFLLPYNIYRTFDSS